MIKRLHFTIAKYMEIVEAASSTIEVRRDPSGIAYTDIEQFDAGAQVTPLCLPDAILTLKQLFSSS